MIQLERFCVLVEDGELVTVTPRAQERNCREEFKGTFHPLNEIEITIRILTSS